MPRAGEIVIHQAHKYRKVQALSSMYVMVRSFLLLYSVVNSFSISFKGYFIICGKEVVTPRPHFYNPLSCVFRRKQFIQNKKHQLFQEIKITEKEI